MSRQSASPATSILVEDAKGRQKYLRAELLGKGGFAKVYRFTQLATNRVFAGAFASTFDTPCHPHR